VKPVLDICRPSPSLPPFSRWRGSNINEEGGAYPSPAPQKRGP